jgi:hypothetical protein
MPEIELSESEMMRNIFEISLMNESKIDLVLNVLAELLSVKRNEPFETIKDDLNLRAHENYQASLERLFLRERHDRSNG